jgi:hypothetical protein
MSGSKRPSTSSLRRFLVSRAYVPVAEIRRRFGLGDPDEMSCIRRDGRSIFIGLPEREALKLEDLWCRDEVGLELSVEVRAPVVVGIYPMRIARYIVETNGNGHGPFTSPSRPREGPAIADERPTGFPVPREAPVPRRPATNLAE